MAKKKRKFTIPGYTPDYYNIAQNDAGYQQFHAGQVANSAADKATRNQGILAQLIQFGALPEGGLGDVGDFGVTPEQQAAINASTASGQSQTAQMQFGHNKSLQDLQDTLAARGIMRSGALGSGLNLEQQRYSNEQSSNRQKLLALLAELQGTFAGAEAGRTSDDATELGSVVSNLQNSGLYEPRPSHEVTATKVGDNLYQDESGNYYDQDGNSVDLTARALHGGRRRRRARYQPGYRP